mmetsp:Transcript_28558/g.82337  ORF Transcript_28558/g.82337 Transcript_28558/m.82337 type:complete len:208 (+) Transcript_28558:323-946(+)
MRTHMSSMSLDTPTRTARGRDWTGTHIFLCLVPTRRLPSAGQLAVVLISAGPDGGQGIIDGLGGHQYGQAVFIVTAQPMPIHSRETVAGGRQGGGAVARPRLGRADERRRPTHRRALCIIATWRIHHGGRQARENLRNGLRRAARLDERPLGLPECLVEPPPAASVALSVGLVQVAAVGPPPKGRLVQLLSGDKLVHHIAQIGLQVI